MNSRQRRKIFRSNLLLLGSLVRVKSLGHGARVISVYREGRIVVKYFGASGRPVLFTTQKSGVECIT